MQFLLLLPWGSIASEQCSSLPGHLPPSLISCSHVSLRLQWETNDLCQLHSCCIFLPIATLSHYQEKYDCLEAKLCLVFQGTIHQSTFLPHHDVRPKDWISRNCTLGQGSRESFHGHISHLMKEFTMFLEDRANPYYCFSSAL